MKRFISVVCVMAFSAAITDARFRTPPGTVNGQTYKNETLGLSFTVPPDWRLSVDPSPGDGEDFLFSVTRAERNLEGPLMVWIASFQSRDKKRTAAEVLADDENGIKAMLPLAIDREIHDEKISGVDFACIDVHMDFSDDTAPNGILRVHQRLLSTIRNGYELGCLIRFRTKDELRDLEGVFNSVSFAKIESVPNAD